MDSIVRNFFIYLSQNKALSMGARRWGLALGAKNVVAGTNITELIDEIKKLNSQGISCTIDNLGEFVHEREKALKAKERILKVINAIDEEELNAHISLKPSQLGLDIDYEFCLSNLREIVKKASSHQIFVNFDMEDYDRLQASFNLLEELSVKFDNIGTVIQAYFYRSHDDIKKYKDFRLRIVKGAYKEEEEVAYQDKADIYQNYIKLIEWYLLNGKFASIATHDHHVINHVKQFTNEHNISKNKFEFQMLYGFREDLQAQLSSEGYQISTYVPFGDDWYGYFMRRLAERPQNLNLLIRQVFNRRTNTIIGFGIAAFILGRLSKK